jgi:hypothetical protein
MMMDPTTTALATAMMNLTTTTTMMKMTVFRYPAVAPLHLLLNVRFWGGAHWATNFLNNRREFTLIIPVSECLSFGLAVAYVYLLDRTDNPMIMCRFIGENGKMAPPFSVAQYDL